LLSLSIGAVGLAVLIVNCHERSATTVEKQTLATAAMVVAHITLISGCDKLDAFIDAIKGKTIVTFDVEGVNLSRTGQPTLCSVGIDFLFHVHVFVFDISDIAVDHQRRQINTLKSLLEATTITKIIHDCRQDSDSLNEFFGIRIVNVFDTSVYNMEIKGSMQRDNLNNTLAYYDCPINPGRNNKAFYKERPNYWLERPLTAEQITSAAQDVTSLFLLRERILQGINYMSYNRLKQIQKASEDAISENREKRFVHYMEIPKKRSSHLLGPGRLRLRHVVIMSKKAVSDRKKEGFLILALTQADLDNAINMMKDVAWKKKYTERTKKYTPTEKPISSLVSIIEAVDTSIQAGAVVTKNPKNNFSRYFSFDDIYEKTLSKLKHFISRPDWIRNLIYYSLMLLMLLYLHFTKQYRSE
jgi:3'-5' exonuclease